MGEQPGPSEESGDRRREYARRWREANPERTREINRDSARRRAEADRAAAPRRAKERERARRRREADPDGVRQYGRAWTEAHPEKVRAYNRTYADTHRRQLRERAEASRDRDPAAHTQRHRDWVAQNREHVREYQRQYRRDPEKYQRVLDANRNAKRLARRLRTLDLPPKQIHPTRAGERRANQRDADRFFTSTLTRAHYMQYDAFEHALERHVWNNAQTLRERAQTHIDGRARAGLPTQTLEDALLVHAVWDVVAQGIPCDQLHAADITRAVEYVRGTHARHRTEQRLRKIVDTVATYTKRHALRLHADADLENRARTIAGKPAIRVDALAHRIAFSELEEKLDLTELTPPQIGKALNLARERHPVLFDPIDTGPVARSGSSERSALSVKSRG